jgi:hypothetical protein
MTQSMPNLHNFNQNAQASLPIREDRSRVTASRARNSYGDELRRQMEEDKRRKRKSQEKDKDDDIHFLHESYNYQPFGKGGGGNILLF